MGGARRSWWQWPRCWRADWSMQQAQLAWPWRTWRTWRKSWLLDDNEKRPSFLHLLMLTVSECIQVQSQLTQWLHMLHLIWNSWFHLLESTPVFPGLNQDSQVLSCRQGWLQSQLGAKWTLWWEHARRRRWRPLPGLSTTGRLALPMATKATKAMMQTGSQVPHPSPTDGKAGLGRRGAESHDMKVLWWEKMHFFGQKHWRDHLRQTSICIHLRLL